MASALGKPQRKSWDVEFAKEAVIYRAHDFIVTQMRMGNRLVDRQHWRVRYAIFIEQPENLVIARHRIEPLLDQALEFFDVGHTIIVVFETWIVRQLGPPHCRTQITKLMLRA